MRNVLKWVAAWVMGATVLAACAPAPAVTAPRVTPGPIAQGSAGEPLFNQHCAVCHGVGALGTQQGPPLVDKIYEPSHHGDAAFVLAARNGSKQHHWNFGDMPAQPQVTEAQVKAITEYVRGLQRAAGIR